MLRRKVFDAVQRLDDFHFYDICAGSGAMGIEAWSRGAASVTFVESHPKALGVLQQNLKALQSKFQAESTERVLKLEKVKFEQWQKRSIANAPAIIFFDPPYKDHALYESLLNWTTTLSLTGELWVESDHLSGVLPSFFSALGEPERCYEHSDSWLARWKIS